MTGLPNPYSVPVVSIEVAGQLLGMSRTSAYSAAARGEIPTVSFNGAMRVPVAALYVLVSLPVPAPMVRPVVDH